MAPPRLCSRGWAIGRAHSWHPVGLDLRTTAKNRPAKTESLNLLVDTQAAAFGELPTGRNFSARVASSVIINEPQDGTAITSAHPHPSPAHTVVCVVCCSDNALRKAASRVERNRRHSRSKFATSCTPSKKRASHEPAVFQWLTSNQGSCFRSHQMTPRPISFTFFVRPNHPSGTKGNRNRSLPRRWEES